MNIMEMLLRKKTLTVFIIWLKKFFSPNDFEEITKTERDAISIFNILVKNSKSELLIYPADDKYYIKSADAGIFIMLSTNQSEISIINHVYGYNVRLGHRALSSMTKTFLNEVEKRRTQMEQEYTSNIQHSLNHITKTIKERL